MALALGLFLDDAIEATRNHIMSIIPLFTQSAFEPETIDFLVSVFDAAWKRVEQSGSKLASPAFERAAQEIIAKRIIEMAQRGERDPATLADDAVNYLQRAYA
jgi:hypothetical protein